MKMLAHFHRVWMVLAALALVAAWGALLLIYVNYLSEGYDGSDLWPSLVKLVAWVALAAAVVLAVSSVFPRHKRGEARRS